MNWIVSLGHCLLLLAANNHKLQTTTDLGTLIRNEGYATGIMCSQESHLEKCRPSLNLTKMIEYRKLNINQRNYSNRPHTQEKKHYFVYEDSCLCFISKRKEIHSTSVTTVNQRGKQSILCSTKCQRKISLIVNKKVFFYHNIRSLKKTMFGGKIT